jgi:hypothetical protein
MSQACLEGNNHIIRIDQFLINNLLQVIVFLFDAKENSLVEILFEHNENSRAIFDK